MDFWTAKTDLGKRFFIVERSFLIFSFRITNPAADFVAQNFRIHFLWLLKKVTRIKNQKKIVNKRPGKTWLPKNFESNMSAAASAARQASAVQATEEEEETSFVDLEVVTKHGITKTDVNKFKEAGFHTVICWSSYFCGSNFKAY